VFDNKTLLEKLKPEIAALAVLPVIVFLIYNVSNTSNHYKQNEERLERNKEAEYKDVVVEKGRLEYNRNRLYLKRKNSDVYGEDEMIWQKVTVGDSLLKIKDSPILIIKKKDTIITVDYRDIYKHDDSVIRARARK